MPEAKNRIHSFIIKDLHGHDPTHPPLFRQPAAPF